MKKTIAKIEKPQRWDTPFAEKSLHQDVDWLLSTPPFSTMDPESFSRNLPLRGILQNDCRINRYTSGEIVLREGDYGHSAFLILSGELQVALQNLPAELLGRHKPKKKTLFESISQLWNNSRHPETRDYFKDEDASAHTRRDADRVFIQDIPRVLDLGKTETLVAGEFFGEIAALTRTPRTATIIAQSDATVLEIRWQGLRDLMKSNESLRRHIDDCYRQHSLKSHLRHTDLLAGVSETILDQLSEQIQFETYGNFDWQHQFKSSKQKDIAEQIRNEPLIAEQGDYPNGLLLIRNGFARLSRPYGAGHQTVAYLGKGSSFGLRELAHNWSTGEQRCWSLSLRAVGYVDILRIPTTAVERLVLPYLESDQLPARLSPLPREPQSHSGSPPTAPGQGAGQSGTPTDRRQATRKQTMQTDLLEFLMDHRFVNGTQTMMIDMNQCTRCDDCVRACAATHDNNPRFVRSGPMQDGFMIAGACMHCLDPVCMIGCPTGAISRDPGTGSVIINDKTCIGCSTCANSCPYDNIRMVHIRDPRGNPIVDTASGQPIEKATKCDLCSEQLGGPACQNACPHDALVRIDLSNADEVSRWVESRS